MTDANVTFDWASLPEEREAPKPKTVNKGAKFDPNSIPAVIREKVERAFADTMKAGKTVAKEQPCASEEQAEAFVKLAKKYAMYRPEGQITVRGRIKEGNVVHFSAKPVERRTPKGVKPGADKPEAPKPETPKGKAGK